MGRSIQVEAIDRLSEDSIYYLRLRREYAAKRAKLLGVVDRLESAGQINLERARNRVVAARAELREAEEECARAEEVNGQEAEVLAELRKLSEDEDRDGIEGERLVAVDAEAAGFSYAHADLLSPGGVVGMVTRRKARRKAKPVAAVEEAS